MSVAFPIDGSGGSCSDGGGGCNKLATAEFWRRFNADREPPDERAEPLPAEVAERTFAAPANGTEAVEATPAEPVVVTPGRGAEAVFAVGAVPAGIVSLGEAAVVCVTGPAAIPDAGAASGVRDDVAGAVIEAMVGRLMKAR